jgi:hypothetical protein
MALCCCCCCGVGPGANIELMASLPPADTTPKFLDKLLKKIGIRVRFLL